MAISQKVKDNAILVGGILGGAGGLPALLTFLGVKPVTGQQYITLVSRPALIAYAVVLYGILLAVAVYFRNRSSKLERERDEARKRADEKQGAMAKEVEAGMMLQSKLREEKNRERPMRERAGIVAEKAIEADTLRNELEEIWHAYHNADPTKPLIHPLAGGVIPEVVADWKDKRLWIFRTVYNLHILELNKVDPSFRIELGPFPCNEEYIATIRNLEKHATLLRGRAIELRRADILNTVI
jgi:hypothetical protein